MFQLKFSDDFKSIIEDIPYWKKEQDINDNIIDFIKKESNNIVIYDESTKKCHCSKCLTELDSNFFCKTCNKQHKNYSNYLSKHDEDYIEPLRYLKPVDQIKYYYNDYCVIYNHFYVFDIVKNKIILYLLNDRISYTNIYSSKAIKHDEIEIQKIYLIEQKGLTDIFENKYHPFDYEDKISFDDDNFNDQEFEKYMSEKEFFSSEDKAILYLENIQELNKTIYKYSSLSNYANYLNENEAYISLAQLTSLPLHYKSFEYLLKFGLYNLAFHSAYEFKKGTNFHEIFGVDKSYLPFMVENNITYDQLTAIRLCQTKDLDLINFMSSDSYISYISKKIVNDFKVNMSKLKTYFDKNNLTNDYLTEYHDYIEMAQKLGFDITDKSILYPKNLILEHDKLYLQIQINKNPQINEKIKDIATLLSFNYYEDKEYVIFPATSIASLIDESTQQQNCVRTYCERIAKNECQIYFMRKKEEQDKSLVTIEVRNNKITQARTKYNKPVEEKLLNVLKKWEKTLIPVIKKDK